MTEEKINHALSVISRSRLECLFDGIFAIAMTLLVLELKVPELADRESTTELAGKLAAFAPTYGSYLLSFMMLGMLWYRHNQQYHHFQIITGAMLSLQLVQLAAAAFFPFSAALLGRYPTNSISGAIYVGCIFGYLWAGLANWITAKREGALKPEVALTDYLRIRNRLVRNCALISVIWCYFAIKILAR